MTAAISWEAEKAAEYLHQEIGTIEECGKKQKIKINTGNIKSNRKF